MALMLVLLLSPPWGSGQLPQPTFKKEWTFRTKMSKTEVIIGVVRPPNDEKALGMSLYSPKASEFDLTLAEEAGFVDKVLRELPSVGADPRALSYIVTDIHQQDVMVNLALAAARSPRSKTRIGWATALLNESHAFDPLNAVLKPYGLHIGTIGGVEEFIVEKLIDSPIANNERVARLDKNMRTLTVANFVIVIEKADKN